MLYCKIKINFLQEYKHLGPVEKLNGFCYKIIKNGQCPGKKTDIYTRARRNNEKKNFF